MGGSSRGRFATPAGFPPREGSPDSHVHVRRERLGSVHRSRAVFWSPRVPNRSVTIRDCFVAARHPPPAAALHRSTSTQPLLDLNRTHTHLRSFTGLWGLAAGVDEGVEAAVAMALAEPGYVEPTQVRVSTPPPGVRRTYPWAMFKNSAQVVRAQAAARGRRQQPVRRRDVHAAAGTRGAGGVHPHAAHPPAAAARADAARGQVHRGAAPYSDEKVAKS